MILSGTGADGSLGLRAVKETGGLVIAQDPNEAAFEGMPRNAILTGKVDLVFRWQAFRVRSSNSTAEWRSRV